MNRQKKFVTMDGNEAVAQMACPFTEIAVVYPGTPSSPMMRETGDWVAQGRKNLLGQTVTLTEMQSEDGAIAAVLGALQTGALATTFASSQGLLRMIPTFRRIAGEQLPGVIHVASCTMGTPAISSFGDHSDVMNCRQTGLAMLSAGSVQEAADLAAVAHLAAVKGQVPFLHFFDGFGISHEVNKVELPAQEALGALLDQEALRHFRERVRNPEHSTLRSPVQNGVQVIEACNPFCEALPDIVEDYFQKVRALTGREYHLFHYYGDPLATDVVIAMGAVSGAAHEAVDTLRAQGKKVGYLQVHLYRPFSADHFLRSLPESVRRVAVLDRCKEMDSAGEPLYRDVCAVLSGNDRQIVCIGGRYGLSFKDTPPAQIAAVFENLEAPEPLQSFAVGITDDVPHQSLAVRPLGRVVSDQVACKFWSVSGDGVMDANLSTVRIINETTEKYAQAYFECDTGKPCGVLKSHLRFSSRPITSSYYIREADFVVCCDPSLLNQYDMVSELRSCGILLLNCGWEPGELEQHIPAAVRRAIAEKQLRLFTIDATEIAGRLDSHADKVLQAAFFALMEIIPKEQALEAMWQAARKACPNEADKVIAAIDEGAAGVREISVPVAWAWAWER